MRANQKKELKDIRDEIDSDASEIRTPAERALLLNTSYDRIITFVDKATKGDVPKFTGLCAAVTVMKGLREECVELSSLVAKDKSSGKNEHAIGWNQKRLDDLHA